jgi:hypothetical protein
LPLALSIATSGPVSAGGGIHIRRGLTTAILRLASQDLPHPRP